VQGNRTVSAFIIGQKKIGLNDCSNGMNHF